jgi:hypothetical protein
MRMMLLATAIALACCGSNGGSDGGDLGVSDAADDLGYQPAIDANPFRCEDAGVCGAGSICCIDIPPDGGVVNSCVQTCTGVGAFPVTCAGPGYCGGNPCCVMLQNARPTDVSCSSAMTDCPPMANLTGTGQTRVCNVDADCTAGAPNTLLTQCCHLVATGDRICFNQSFVPLAKGTIACP